MPDANEVHGRVTKMLVQSLGVEEDDVIPSATLQGDLGGSRSTSWISSFGWSVNSASRSRQRIVAEPHLPDDPVFAGDGRLTDEGLTAPPPHAIANFRDLEFDRQLNGFDDLFTVEPLTSFITWRLRGNGQAGSDVPVQVSHQTTAGPTAGSLTIQQALLSEQPRLMPSRKVADSSSTAFRCSEAKGDIR